MATMTKEQLNDLIHDKTQPYDTEPFFEEWYKAKPVRKIIAELKKAGWVRSKYTPVGKINLFTATKNNCAKSDAYALSENEVVNAFLYENIPDEAAEGYEYLLVDKLRRINNSNNFLSYDIWDFARKIPTDE